MGSSPRRVQRIEIEWFDIESDAGWGEGEKQPPVVVQIGYLHARPRRTDRIPCWRIKTSQVEGEPGGMTIIPAVNVLRVEMLGWRDVPWRKR